METAKNPKTENKPLAEHITSRAFDNGTLYELLYDPNNHKTRLACWQNNKLEVKSSFKTIGGKIIVPYRPENPLLLQRIILFPKNIEEYGNDENLVNEVRLLIHRYVDVSESFEIVSTYYVLLSWVYDTFNEIPYLRLRGDYGSGKTRFLQTIGSLCYKPIFASGASTVAPLFHILDQVGGTLVLDESDFRFSDEKADIAKILNCGNAKGFPVLRCEKINQREFAPRAYIVFSPKIVASRNDFDDIALESRFISEETGLRKVRDDIPVTLPENFQEEALRIRNKLLLWRFRNFTKKRFPQAHFDPKLDRRTNQIYGPLLSLVADAKIRARIIEVAKIHGDQLRMDRGFMAEADVLRAIKECYSDSHNSVSISQITKFFSEKFGHQYDQRITPKWIGIIIRKKLRLSTRKSNGVYILSENQKMKIKRLYQKYDV